MNPAPATPLSAPAPTPIAEILETRYIGLWLAVVRQLSTCWVRVQQNEKCCTDVAPNVAAIIQPNQCFTPKVQHCNVKVPSHVYARARARAHARFIISCCTVAVETYLSVIKAKSLQHFSATKVQQNRKCCTWPLTHWKHSKWVVLDA